jgi:ABC-2 type transport system permease protein
LDGSFLAVGMACLCGVLLMVGAAGGLIYGITSGDLASGLREVLAMSASKIPPVWTVAGLAALLYGFWPQGTPLAWGFWFSFSMLELAWEAQVISWSALQLSPFAYAHYTIRASVLPLLPLLILLAWAIALMALGLLGYSRRDLRLGA